MQRLLGCLMAGAAMSSVLAFSGQAVAADDSACVSSPNQALTFCVQTGADGAHYVVSRNGQPLIAPSALGLTLRDRSTTPVNRIVRVTRDSKDATWEQPWGEQRVIRDHHNEARVSLAGRRGATPYDLVVRVFDDGFGFRYDYKSLGAQEAVAITDEATQFNLIGSYDAWWYPARGPERDEYLYQKSPLNEVGLAETPFTLEGAGGTYLSIHEAALTQYASMNLKRTGENQFKADLMPWSDGTLVYRTGPFETPWRMVLVGDSPAALADSRIELNLNEPNKLGDISWFQPGKYVGVWWEMHLNKSTWGSGEMHGANNANVRRYIDFAAANGFNGVLVEGWNLGWDGDWVANGDKFNFTQSYPDFDLPGLAAYAQSKGTNIIGHHETGGAVPNYEAQMEAGYDLYQSVGVHVIKTGYVRPSGTIVRGFNADGTPQHEWFAGQYRVEHELRAALEAAQRNIALNAHEPVKDTGMRRTYPTMISREGARGQEFNAWGRPTNPPEHVTILPFTRMLAGPMDYTPGIFDLTFGKTDVNERVQSTLATQLALYVVLYSPVQMAADLPENYAKHPDAFQFILDVPTDWETTRTLDSKIGDYTVIARQQRGGSDWFLGAVTDEQARTLPVKLDFLDPAKRYEAQIYRDGPGANYLTNPYAFETAKQIVTARDVLNVAMGPGGGQAIRFRALNE